MQNGRIPDEGTYQDLRLNSSLFGHLWQQQDEQVMA
jgi:hypothetical protein